MLEEGKIDYTEPLPSYKNPKNILTAEYKILCTRILNQFLQKQETNLEFWLADIIGQAVCVGGGVVEFEDIILDLELDAPKGCIWDYLTYLENNPSQFISYSEYIKTYSKK